MSNNNSKIYFITDADAKDAYLENEVKNGLKEKNLELIAILTGKCSDRTKRDGRGKENFLIPFLDYLCLSLVIWPKTI